MSINDNFHSNCDEKSHYKQFGTDTIHFSQCDGPKDILFVELKKLFYLYIRRF